MSGIIVGADWSDQSRRALTWAMREASARHIALTVINVRIPAPRATGIYWPVPDPSVDPLSLQAERQAARQLRLLVNEVATQADVPMPDVTVTAVTGDPAQELVRASRDADLLVVGDCHRRGLVKLLMGSVTAKVTEQAACPVTVVRAQAA
jgi:nucleotide-binding universal stress UspA family protein